MGDASPNRMSLTAYQSKLFAYELKKRSCSDTFGPVHIGLVLAKDAGMRNWAFTP
jgi:hypothetical protein